MKYSGIYFAFLFMGVISAFFICPVIATDIAEQGLNQAAKVSSDTLSNGTAWNDYTFAEVILYLRIDALKDGHPA